MVASQNRLPRASSLCLPIGAFHAAFRRPVLQLMLALARIRFVGFLVAMSSIRNLGCEDFKHVIWDHSSSMTMALLQQAWS